MTTSDTATAADTGDERALAAALFNRTWELIEREDRSQDDDDRMLHMAHASRYHWGNVGTAADDISETDDRELLLADLESIPGQQGFW
jgi:hypothetical protein